MVVGYLVPIEMGKKIFYRAAVDAIVAPKRHDETAHHLRRLRRRAARFSTASRVTAAVARK
jgi:hypothetical protein